MDKKKEIENIQVQITRREILTIKVARKPDTKNFKCQTSFIDEPKPNKNIEENAIEIQEAEQQEMRLQDKELHVHCSDDESDSPQGQETNDGKKFEIETENLQEKKENKLSYANLESSLVQTHPTDHLTHKRFSIFKHVGRFPIFLNVDKNGEQFIPISKVEMEIGLGPSLMLHTAKAMTILFLILSILNIPLFVFFNSGTATYSRQANETLSGPDIIFRLSVGNLGQDQLHCVQSHRVLANFVPLDIKCDFGTISYIESISIKNEETACVLLTKQEREIAIESTSKCSSAKNNFINSNKFTKLKQDFNLQCRDKPSCKLDVGPIADLDYRCMQNANLTVGVHCVQKYVEMPFKVLGDNKLMKQDFAFFVVVFDFVAVCILVAFGIWIEKRQNQYIEAFKEQAIQMDDYAIKVSGLPPIDYFKGDEHLLKAKLLMHFQQLFLPQIQKKWDDEIQLRKKRLSDHKLVREFKKHMEDKITNEFKEKIKSQRHVDYMSIPDNQFEEYQQLPQPQTTDQLQDKYFGQLTKHHKQKNGKGFQIYSDGSMYEGSWRKDKRHGLGRWISKDMSVVYHGNWKDDKYHGKGSLMWPEANYELQYNGNFNEGVKDGQGTLIFLKQTKKQAKGQESNNNEAQQPDILTGVWKNNKISSRCTFVSNLKYYEGFLGFRPSDTGHTSITNDQFNKIKEYLWNPFEMGAVFDRKNTLLVWGTDNGYGIINNTKEAVYEGLLKDCQPHGIGIFQNQIFENVNSLWRKGELICLLNSQNITGEINENQMEKLMGLDFFNENSMEIDGLDREAYIKKQMREFDIVDISFGNRSTEEVEQLVEIQPIYQKLKLKNQYSEEQIKWLKLTQKYYDRYIKVQESKFDKMAWKFQEKINSEAETVKDWTKPKYAYITFRKISAREQVEKKYQVSNLQSILLFLGNIWNLECLSRQRRKIISQTGDELKINQQYLINVQNGGIPNEIKWLNLKYTKINRIYRQIVVLIVSAISICLGIALLVLFQRIADGGDIQESFCKKSAASIIEQTSEEPEDQDSIDYAIIISGVVINIIDQVLSWLFELLQDFEKNHTVGDDTISLFGKTTIMQFVNIAVMQLVLGFRLEQYTETCFLGFVPAFRGKYQDFSADWYREVGATLGVTLLMNIFSSHYSNVVKYVVALVLRCRDRGWQRSAFESQNMGVNEKAIAEKSMENNENDLANPSENKQGDVNKEKPNESITNQIKIQEGQNQLNQQQDSQPFQIEDYDDHLESPNNHSDGNKQDQDQQIYEGGNQQPITQDSQTSSIEFVVVGSSKVGKASFIKQVQTHSVQDSDSVYAAITKFKIEELQIEINIQKQDPEMRTPPYWKFEKDKNGIFALFDVTNYDSFRVCTELLSHYKKQKTQPQRFVLVGTHADKVANRKVKYEEAAQFASENEMKYFEASNQNSVGYFEAFKYLASQILQQRQKEQQELKMKNQENEQLPVNQSREIIIPEQEDENGPNLDKISFFNDQNPFEIDNIHETNFIDMNKFQSEKTDEQREVIVKEQENDLKEENVIEPEENDQKLEAVPNDNEESFIKVQLLSLVEMLWNKFAYKVRVADDKCDLRTRQSIQEDVVQLYTGIEMDSAGVYTEIITTYWCVIMFSSGMPVLYLVGLLYFFCFYWIYKALILRYFQKATHFNQDLGKKATNMIHIAVAWHILTASMMLSNSSIFGQESDISNNLFYPLVSTSEILTDRFRSHSSLYFIGLNLILILVYIFAILVVKGLSMKSIWRNCCSSHGSNKQDKTEQRVDYKSGFYKDLSFEEIRNFNQRIIDERRRAQKYLNSYQKAIKKDGKLAQDLEKAFPENERELYKKWLETRQISVKAVITFHYRNLIGFLEQKELEFYLEQNRKNRPKNLEDKERSEQVKTNEIKIKEMRLQMKILIDGPDSIILNESRGDEVKLPAKKATSNELIQKFLEVVEQLRLMKINYDNPDCFQLTDVVQSFNMYDSQEYKDAKEVKDFLEQKFIQVKKPLKHNTAKRFLEHQIIEQNNLEAMWGFLKRGL